MRIWLIQPGEELPIDPGTPRLLRTGMLAEMLVDRGHEITYWVRLNRDIRPDLVLIPNSYDTHQDHYPVHEESFRAFKHCSILGYKLPQNLIRFTNSAFPKLSDENLQNEICALSHYESQSSRPYSSSEFIKGLAKGRGGQGNHDYAEAFEVIRLIL